MAKKRSRSRSASPVPPTTPSSSAKPPSTPPTTPATKKKKKSSTRAAKDPQTLADADSLERVPSALRGTVLTTPPIASEGDLVAERLRKEICERFGFSLASSTAPKTGEKGGGAAKAKAKANVVRTRLVVGANACTRALEAAAAGRGRARARPPPSLAILARDVRPPITLAHIPVLCRDVGTPLLLLPGKASVELGRALGVRSATALIFLPRSTDGEEETKEVNSCHRGIDSFVKYASSKVREGKEQS